MSQVTLREMYVKSELVARKEVQKERRTLRKDLRKLYHGINDYFGIQEGTTDVIWWWGFLAFCGATGIFLLVMNVLTAGV